MAQNLYEDGWDAGVAKQQALVAIMGKTITNLMDALDRIGTVAWHGAPSTATLAIIAKLADDAIEAAKALTKQEN
jgi:hypothetical protein